jgi:hypothetical protein
MPFRDSRYGPARPGEKSPINMSERAGLTGMSQVLVHELSLAAVQVRR